jgi:hypothetical protein
MPTWGRALLGLALACAAAVGLLGLEPNAPVPVVAAIVLLAMMPRAEFSTGPSRVRIAPKTSPPRA